MSKAFVVIEIQNDITKNYMEIIDKSNSAVDWASTAVAANGFPFEIKRQPAVNPYAAMTEEEILDKLKAAREQGQFRDADSAVSDMRLKYGL